MSRYIDADKIIEFINNRFEITWTSDDYEGGIKDACCDILEVIERQPTADVKPVVSGNWINTTHGLKCSTCDTFQAYGSRYFNYCPICGARMEAGK